ncbi:MAG: lactonase family protein [Chitinophagaceae bacterium]
MKKISFLCFLFFMIYNVYSQSFYLFAGTYTNKGSKGIYIYQFNANTGAAKLISNTDSVANPSYLAISPDGKFVYSVNETGGNRPGFVSAFSFDNASGKLKFINSQPSGGDHPCYITIDKTNSWVVVGNYTGGNIAALPVNKDGSLKPYAQLIQHKGSGTNKARQEKAHVHATVFSPDQRWLFTPDLGMDALMIYPFTPSASQPFSEKKSAAVKVLPGNGPRHFVFHPSKKFAYLIEELSGSVAAYGYSNGKLKFLQRFATHPSNYKGAIGSADIHLSPDGKFLYASNRGDANTITIFSVAQDGKLQWKGYQSTGGIHPRNFMIDPTGNWLLVANRDTDNIVIFKRNKQTGILAASGNEIKLSSPVFLKMIKF